MESKVKEMHIHEAVKKAIEIDGYITVGKGEKFEGRLFIKPTNTNGGCIVCVTPDKQRRCWQPYADELMSHTWRVITKEEFLSPLVNHNLS